MDGVRVDDRPRSGRPRDPSRDEAIVAATLAIFAEEGYAGVGIEGVAARAGVGKATIYRRFSSKEQLVVHAVSESCRLTDHLPDTGDVRADLAAMLHGLIDKLRSPNGPVLLAFMSERLRYPELAAEFERSVVGAKRAHSRGLVTRAVERGDLPPDSDVQLIAESGPALIWHHALYGMALTDDLPERIMELVLPRPQSTTAMSPGRVVLQR